MIGSVILKRLRQSWVGFAGLAFVLICATSCLMLLLSVLYFFMDPGRLTDRDLYRIDTEWTSRHSGRSGVWATSPDPLALLTRQQFGDRALAGRFTPLHSYIKVGESRIPGEGLFRSDPPSLAVFDWPILAGKRLAELGPGEAIITQKEAHRLFGEADPLGQRITIEGSGYRGASQYFVIAAIVEIAKNAVFQPRLVAIEAIPGRIERRGALASAQELPLEWMRPNTYSFIRLVGGTEGADGDKIVAALTRNAPNLGGWTPSFKLRAARDLWFSNGVYEELVVPIPPASINLLVTITALLFGAILLSAVHAGGLSRSIVHSLTQSLDRIAVRPRVALTVQLGVAAVFAAMIAAAGSYLGLSITSGSMHLLGLADTGFAAPTILPVATWLVLAFSLLGFAFAGLYRRRRIGAGATRWVLLVTFFLGGTVAGGSIILSLQHLHLARHPSGIDQERTLAITVARDDLLAPRLDGLKQELSALPGVLDVGFAKALPGDRSGYSYFELRAAKDRNATQWRYQALAADAGFLRALKVPVLAGELPSYHSNNQHLVVLTRSALHQAGFAAPHEALGEELLAFDNEMLTRFRIAAVVEDFRVNGQQERAPSLVIYYEPALFRALLLRYAVAPSAADIDAITTVWQRFVSNIEPQLVVPQVVFRQADRQAAGVSMLVIASSLMTMLVVSGSLFAAIRFHSIVNHRELELRRLVGARSLQLAPDYVRRVVGPFVLALPLAFISAIFLGSSWLDGFSERLEILSWPTLTMLAIGITAVTGLAMLGGVAFELMRVTRNVTGIDSVNEKWGQ